MELMPTTSPCRLRSGPPELPGFTATSVWMNGTYISSGSERPLALTIPAVMGGPFGAADPGVDGVGEAERRADCRDPVAGLEARGFAEPGDRQVGRVHLDKRHVPSPLDANHFRLALAPW